MSGRIGFLSKSDLDNLHPDRAVADPFGLRIGKELRKVLGAHQPSEQWYDQRLLNVFFSI